MLNRTKLLLNVEFAAIWGNKWLSYYQSEDITKRIMANWHYVLKKMTDEQIYRGLKKCRALCEWAPSIAEFRNYALDILSVAEATNIFIMGDYGKNEIVDIVGRPIDYEKRYHDAEYVTNMFKAAYKLYINRHYDDYNDCDDCDAE